ncbi:MAG TPA: hypothetical protein VG708_15780, partial [Mycobacteriales bacterium]|nr:hypothetical protein [Mycobacteriales bacterium]
MGRAHAVQRDVDLDKEIIRDKQGRRITEERAREIVDELLPELRRRGRPSLTGGNEHSPTINVRISKALEAAVLTTATRRG